MTNESEVRRLLRAVVEAIDARRAAYDAEGVPAVADEVRALAARIFAVDWELADDPDVEVGGMLLTSLFVHQGLRALGGADTAVALTRFGAAASRAEWFARRCLASPAGTSVPELFAGYAQEARA